MSLPSQGGIGFGGATRGRRRRGRGGSGRKLLAGVVVVAAVGGLVWAFTGGDSPAEAEGGQDNPTTELAQRETKPQTGRPTDTQRREPDAGRLVSAPAVEVQQSQPQPQVRTVPQQGQGEHPVGTDSAGTQPGGSGVLATPSQTEQAGTPTVRPSPAIATLLERGESALKANDPVAAREHFNQALMHEGATNADRARIREQMATLNADLIFSPRVYPGDPFSTVYEVKGGDSLAKIAHDQSVATEYLLIQRVNRMGNPNSIYKGQKLKLVRGPFHAVVSKSAFRMDVYLGPPDETDQWMYVRSFPVGLGEQDGTPVGAFTVRRHSKLIDPFWRNPRTGEEFSSSDPENPIGDHWIGLQGLGQAETYSGYGIHGTIDPGSIGKSMSMGCVRMLPDDVALVYELLTEEISQVHIVD
jgi:LysM repeat protein